MSIRSRWSRRSRSRGRRVALHLAVGAVLATGLAACGEDETTAKGGEPKVEAPEIDDSLTPMQQAEKYDELMDGASQSYKVAVLTTCTDLNAWCQAMTRYQAEAAEKYDVELDMYDAAFDPAKQLRQVQDAIAKGGYDGFIFAPVAAAPGCGMLKQLLDTGLPVQQVNSPVCEEEDFSEGTTGMVSTSSEKYYRNYLEYVFDSCEGEDCKVAVLGGVSGQDGWRRLQSAIADTKEKYDNVEIVVEQPANYDPNQALRITQDAFQRDPDIDVILSAYDEMSRGVLQALDDAGKTPGTDVRLYSIGGTPYGLEQVAAGTITATIQSDPYPEGYFGVVELVRFLETGVKTEGWSSTSEWSGIVEGPGSDILTQENVDKYEPTY